MASFLLACCFIFSFVLTGCNGSPNAKQIVSKSISAINKTQTYALDSNITNIYTVVGGDNQRVNTAGWINSGVFDIRQAKMKMTSTIDSNYSGAQIHWLGEKYIVNRQEFISNQLNYGNSTWVKKELPDKSPISKSELFQQANLLKTASNVVLAGNEKVEGMDCYVLNITPSVQTIIEWVISQEQPYGPQLDVMNGGAITVVRADAYRNASVKLWIDRDTFLPVKAEIQAVFQGDVGEGSITETPYTPSTNPVNSTFNGQVIFSNYNQPVTIELPPEALNAE